MSRIGNCGGLAGRAADHGVDIIDRISKVARPRRVDVFQRGVLGDISIVDLLQTRKPRARYEGFDGFEGHRWELCKTCTSMIEDVVACPRIAMSAC
jgi:hypothetical protein